MKKFDSWEKRAQESPYFANKEKKNKAGARGRDYFIPFFLSKSATSFVTIVPTTAAMMFAILFTSFLLHFDKYTMN